MSKKIRDTSKRLSEMIGVVSGMVSLDFHKRAKVFNDGSSEDHLALEINTLADEFKSLLDSCERLATSEARYRGLFEKMNEGLLFTDPEGKIVLVNSSFCKMIGYTREQLLGKNRYQLFHSEQQGEYVKKKVAAIRYGHSGQYELKFLTKSGSEIRTEVDETPHTDHMQKFLGVMTIVSDLTERKKTLADLKLSELQNRAMLEAIPDQVFRIGTDGTIRYVKRYRGDEIESNEALSHNIRDFFPMDIASQILNSVRLSVESDSTVKHEYELNEGHGNLFFEARFTKCGADEVLMISRNVTKHKRFERELLISEKKYKGLFEGANDAIFIIQPFTLKLLDVNSIAAERLGYTRKELLKLDTRQIDVAFTAEKLIYIKTEFAKKGTVIFEHTHRRKDGSTFPVEVSSRVIEYENQPAYQSIVRDITERKKVENALRENEVQFRSLIETLSEGIIRVDLKDKILYVSEQFCNITGYKESDLLGKRSSDVLLADHAERMVLIAYGKKRLKGISSLDELRIKCANGKIITVSNSGTPVYDAAGKVIGTQGAIHDITDLKKAEQKAKEKEQNFNDLFENASDAIIISDEKTRNILIANQKACNYLGYEQSELLALSLADIESGNGQNTVASAARKNVGIFEHLHKHKSGMLIPVEVSTKMVELRGRTVCQSFVRDITEKKKSMSKLQHANDIIQKSASLIMTINKKGEVIYISPACKKMLGYEPEELMGTQWWMRSTHSDKIANKERKKAIELLKKGLNGKNSYFESRTYTKNGEERWIAWEKSLTEDGNLLGVGLDITHKKIAEEQLKRKNEELESFIYKASHDLKSPLSSTLGLINLINMVKPDEAITYLGKLEESVTRMDEILNNLAKVSIIQQGVPKTSEINVDSLVQKVLDGFRHIKAYQNVEVHVKIKGKGSLYSDPALIEAILQNLIQNSLAYQKKGKGAYIKINANKRRHETIFQISDNGVGIPKKYQGKIFDMFYRANEASKGSGIGLYIVKNAIEKLKGTVNCKSKSGKGTVFTLTLPSNVEK
ncbi:MAG: PAS domain S-box protein [Flavobacteriales bacterium]|nr:PAS domain S-box protein [Flavobacteriales bacterium]